MPRWPSVGIHQEQSGIREGILWTDISQTYLHSYDQNSHTIPIRNERSSKATAWDFSTPQCGIGSLDHLLEARARYGGRPS